MRHSRGIPLMSWHIMASAQRSVAEVDNIEDDDDETTYTAALPVKVRQDIDVETHAAMPWPSSKSSS
jgi:hypothetical protein